MGGPLSFSRSRHDHQSTFRGRSRRIFRRGLFLGASDIQLHRGEQVIEEGVAGLDCQTDCASLDDGQARSACIQRCYAVEDRCTTSGYDGTGSSLAVDQGVGAAKSRKEKEADYEEWRAKRQRERLESGEDDVDIEVIDNE